jgi:hypothetical protein
MLGAMLDLPSSPLVSSVGVKREAVQSVQHVKCEERVLGVGLKREATAASVGTRPGRRALVSSVKREASSAKRWYEALIVEREASVGTVREASIKRAFAQERKAKREASIGIEHCVWAALRAALHNVEHYVDIGVKRKRQVLLVSSVAPKSAGVKHDASAGVKRDASADASAGVERKSKR